MKNNIPDLSELPISWKGKSLSKNQKSWMKIFEKKKKKLLS